MLKKHKTLMLALLLGLPGALSTQAAVTPFVTTDKPETNMFAALTPHQLTKPQSGVNVTVQYPYTGDWNYWYVSFYGSQGNYGFTTSGNTVIGSVPEGTYTVEMEVISNINGGSFDFYTNCLTQSTSTSLFGHHGFARIENVQITEECHDIIINEIR